MKSYRMTVVFSLLLWCLLHLWLWQLSQRQNLSLDLTENQLYDLSAVTEEAVTSLEEATTVLVFARKEEFPAMLVEQLERMAVLSPWFRLEFQDVYENPVLFEQYRQQGYDVNPNDLMVKQEGYQRHIPFESLLLYEGDTVVGIALEQAVIAGVYSLTRGEASVLFSRGHNEMDDSALQSLFSQQYVTVSQGVLADLAEYQLVVIASPKGDVTLEEQELLLEYCENGGMLLVFLDAGVEKLPYLEELLSRYGMEVSPHVVVEEKAFLGNNPLNIMPMYEVHPITAYFQNNAVYTTLPSARGIFFHDQGNPQTLLRSTWDSYGTLDTEQRDPETELEGPFTVAAISQNDLGGGLLLVSSGKAISGDILSSSAYGNRLFFTQVLDYLQEDGDFIQIPPKTMTLEPLVMGGEQGMMFAVLYCVFLPSLVLLYGLAVVVKRKKL